MTHPLTRLLGRDTQPDVIPAHQRAFFENGADDTPPCTCPALDGHAQNPTCPAHPWWRHDPTVLNLADHPDGPWAAALKLYGGRS